jgi:hypothetical protein
MPNCPICAGELSAIPRYPRMVCVACVKRARAANGRPVVFYNQGLSGGLEGRYTDTGEAYLGADCTIDGVPCRAEEAHLGGVVVQVLGDGEGRSGG